MKKYEELTSKEFEELRGRVDTILIPTGSVEVHGQHMPLSTDTIIPEGVAELIAERAGDRALVAPSVNYGHVWRMKSFPGSLDIDGELLTELYYQIGRAIVGQGFEYIVFVNGHDGNEMPVKLAAERLAEELNVAVIVNSWWSDSQPQLRELNGDYGHSGNDETSLVLHFREDLVDMDAATQNDRRSYDHVYIKDMYLDIYPDGMAGNATAATREHGRDAAEAIAAGILRDLEIVWSGDYIHERGWRYR